MAGWLAGWMMEGEDKKEICGYEVCEVCEVLIKCEVSEVSIMQYNRRLIRLSANSTRQYFIILLERWIQLNVCSDILDRSSQSWRNNT